MNTNSSQEIRSKEKTEIDPGRCPLCGEANRCAMILGADACWCFTAAIPEGVLERIPSEAKRNACICPSCAAAQPVTADAAK